MVSEFHIFQIEQQITQIVHDSNHNLELILKELSEIKDRLNKLENEKR